MNRFKDLSDNELLLEYDDLSKEIEECEYGSYSYDCVNADLEYCYGILSDRGLV